MNNKNVKVGVENFTIELNEDIMQRLYMMKECDYMIEEMNRIVDHIIDVCQKDELYSETILDAEEGMRMLSTLQEAKKDYRFLASLVVDKTDDGVLVDCAQAE